MYRYERPSPGQRFRVKVPATTANLGPGFDALGMAIDLFSEVEFEVTDRYEDTVVREITGEGHDFLPRTRNNLIYNSASRLADYIHAEMPPLAMRVVNRIPLARGMGSSASAIIGGLSAANIMFGSPVDDEVLLKLATEIEGHPDNVAPALHGGLVVSSMADGEVLFVRIEPPADLKLIIAIPSFPLSTHAARSALPGMVIYSDAVFNVSRSSLLVAALTQGRYDLLGKAMEDKLHQPYRRKLIQGMDEVFNAAMLAGSHSVALSGAGPSLIAFATENTGQIGDSMQAAWQAQGIDCTVLMTKPSNIGTIPC